MGKRQIVAAEWGIALGLVVAMIILVPSTGRDDFSVHLWPAGRTRIPYSVAQYWYPVWGTWLLRGLGLLPRQVALILVWTGNAVAVLAICRVWKGPAWIVLLSPTFWAAMVYSHPFEAVFVTGLTLAVLGWERQTWWAMGLGLALMLFKMQLAIGPGVIMLLAILFTTRMRRAILVPVGMAALATAADWLWTGELWLIPFVEALHVAPGTVRGWNASLWRLLGPFSLLWLIPGLWLLKQVQGNSRREAWIAMALGLLVGPYWGIGSLWPLVATLGCWKEREVQAWRQ